MIGVQVFWLIVSFCLFVIIAAVIRHVIFKNGTDLYGEVKKGSSRRSHDNKYYEWISVNIVMLAPIISFIIMVPVYFWVSDSCISMRPAVEEVYTDFRENPDNWDLGSDRWTRKSDGVRFSKTLGWMAPKGRASFELTHIEGGFLKMAIEKRDEDADMNRYREFEENSKTEELIK